MARSARQRAAQLKASLASAKKRRRARKPTIEQRRAKSTARYEKKLSKKYNFTKTTTVQVTDSRGRVQGKRKNAGGYGQNIRTEYKLTKKPKKRRGR